MAASGGEDFAGVNACHEELEVVAVFGDAEAALSKDADLPGEAGGVPWKGVTSLVATAWRGDAGDRAGERGPRGARFWCGASLGSKPELLLTEEGRR